MAFADAVSRDLRDALRSLQAHRFVTLVAVLLLAIGIGANTAVFSFVNTMLLAKLPVRNPDGLYQLIVTHRAATHNLFSYEDYQRLQKDFSVFDSVIAWGNVDLRLQIGDTPHQVRSAFVSGNYSDVLDLTPAAGRMLTPADDATNAPVAVLGYGFWTNACGRDPSIVGRPIRINDVTFTVVGVLPRGFGGTEVDYARDVMIPIHTVDRLWPQNHVLQRVTYWLSVLVRLKSGYAMASARPEVQGLWPKLLQATGLQSPDGFQQKLDIAAGARGVSNLRGQVGSGLIILSVMVALVLLVACANIASLLLVRATGRRRDIAVRLAIGATSVRIVRASLAETGVIAAFGGALGVACARWIGRGLLLFIPDSQRDLLELQLDLRLLLYAMLVTGVTFLVISLTPAGLVRSMQLARVINDTGRGGSGSNLRTIRAVVVAQIATCTVLIVGAVLFARSLQNIDRTALGYNRLDIVVVTPHVTEANINNERARVLARELVSRLKALSGIRSATYARMTPLSGWLWWDPAVVSGYTPRPDETTTVYLNAIDPGYFTTWGMPILRGRGIEDRDGPGAPRVAVVSESFAKRFFEGKGLGRQFSVGYGHERQLTDLQIVGIVADSKYADPREPQRELVYIAAEQADAFAPLLVQVRLQPGLGVEAATSAIRRQTSDVFRTAADVEPYDETFDRVTRRDRLVATLSAIFGVAGVLLSCLGIAGVMAYAVMSRTAEICVRMALGATRSGIVRMIVTESLLLAAAGVALGLPLAVLAGRYVSTVLYGLSPADPASLVLASAALLLTAVGGAALPAFRAMGLNPSLALRTQ